MVHAWRATSLWLLHIDSQKILHFFTLHASEQQKVKRKRECGMALTRYAAKGDYWCVAQWRNGSVLPSPVPYQTRSLARSPYHAPPSQARYLLPLNIERSATQRGPCNTGRVSSPPQARCTNALHTSQARCHYVPLHQSSPVSAALLWAKHLSPVLSHCCGS